MAPRLSRSGSLESVLSTSILKVSLQPTKTGLRRSEWMLKLAIVQCSCLGPFLVLNLRLKTLFPRAPGNVPSDMETEPDNARILLGVRRVPFHSLCQLHSM